ncbi:MAG: arylamine N-acetyltransferase [Oscillospiraceae bacterium]|nr:arylamine N-acetyltransferase [Oscillospiraceae bacterium]
MKMNIRKLVPVFAAAVCICAAPAMINHTAVSALAVNSTVADCFTVTENGTFYKPNGVPISGKFMLEPDFLLGDVDYDGCVSATDAAHLLVQIAKIGAGSTVEDVQFFTYADATEDGKVNAADAARILIYAAQKGAGDEVLPLGAAYYCADQNGKLLTGRIDCDGETYYAGDDYKLLTGWVTDENGTYFLDKNGVMLKHTWYTNDAGTTLWLDDTGAVAADTWAETDNGLCWFDTDGTAANGLRILDSKPYFFVNNAVQTGWLLLGEKICFAGEDGVLCEGMTNIGGDVYFFGIGYAMQTGWLVSKDIMYYFNEDGVMCTGWQTIDGLNYYFNENGARRTGLVTLEDGTYYLGRDGIRCSGWQMINGNTYYFSTDSAQMQTGWLTSSDGIYFFGEDGVMCTGWQELDGNTYYFYADGTMATGIVTVDNVTYDFGEDGVSKGEYVVPTNPVSDKDAMLNNAVLSPRRTITVYDQQKGSGKEIVDFTFTLKDADIAIIEQFAAEHFPENSTLAEKLYITHQWIHYNVDYAYAGAKWNEIVNLSYVDAIFNHKKGQCVQYNGAMASVLAYYGYEVYMVKGYTSPGTQHFWTQVEIDGHTYMVECGNSGKNGDWWQEFFNLMY